MAAKHIIITKLFEFSGSNTHLRALVRFLGPENVILVLEDDNQLQFIQHIDETGRINYKIKTDLYGYAHLQYRWTTNLKEFFYLLKSIIYIQLLSVRYGFADITICAVEPEKHLYFFWTPLTHVYYILHTTPNNKYTSFTPYTCNSKLGKRKRIITVSDSNKSLIIEKWAIAEKKRQYIHVIYNCISAPATNRPGNTSLHTQDEIVVLTMGLVIGYKNPETWLKVAEAVTKIRPDVYFLWLGNGPLLDTYLSAVKDHQKISFQGAVLNTYDYLETAHIYYQPSQYETHGIAVVEAMSESLPCVVSNIGGLPESVQHGFNGYLVDPENQQQQVDVILKLIDNCDLRRYLGENSLKRYREKFSFDQFKTQLNSIYH